MVAGGERGEGGLKGGGELQGGSFFYNLFY
jgi:hypothetical protein